MADEFNNQNNGNNQNYAQSANNDMQVQMAVDNAMAEQKKKKKKKKKKRLIIFGVIAAVIVVIIIASSGGSSSDDKNKVESVNGASQTQSADEKSDDSKSDDSTASDNQKITAGHAITIDNELKISYLKCDTNFKKYSKYATVGKGKKVISATFKIKNVSDTDQYIDTINCYADDKKCDSFYSVEDYDDPFFDSISAGRSIEGTVYFEVPSNAKNIELEFENNVWTEDKVVFVVK